jgi:hypothetical protein
MNNTTQWLHCYGWLAAHHELTRLEEVQRLGLRLGLHKPVRVWVQFTNGNTASGTAVFSKSTPDYLVISTASGELPFERYRLAELAHDCVLGLTMNSVAADEVGIA